MTSESSGADSEILECCSDSDDELDANSFALVEAAPLHARIGEALERFAPSVPDAVVTLLSSKGACLASSKLLKVSFNVTFSAELSEPLVCNGERFSRIIIQILGAQLGDGALFGQVSAASLVLAHKLASLAGVRVPKILAVGQCATGIGLLDFVLEEFIETQTIEDEVCAPMDQWHRISAEIQKQLCTHLPTAADSEPLPYFPSIVSQLQWLLELVPSWDVELRGALLNFTDDVLEERSVACPPVLLHQDLNCGNILCSGASDGSSRWALDAVIDWESAAVADPFSLSEQDPWRTVRQFALVVKGSALAERYVRGTLPRCELGQLVQSYDKAAHGMETAGVLKYVPWAARVDLARATLSGGYK